MTLKFYCSILCSQSHCSHDLSENHSNFVVMYSGHCCICNSYRVCERTVHGLKCTQKGRIACFERWRRDVMKTSRDLSTFDTHGKYTNIVRLAILVYDVDWRNKVNALKRANIIKLPVYIMCQVRRIAGFELVLCKRYVTWHKVCQCYSIKNFFGVVGFVPWY